MLDKRPKRIWRSRVQRLFTGNENFLNFAAGVADWGNAVASEAKSLATYNQNWQVWNDKREPSSKRMGYALSKNNSPVSAHTVAVSTTNVILAICGHRIQSRDMKIPARPPKNHSTCKFPRQHSDKLRAPARDATVRNSRKANSRRNRIAF